MRRFSIVTFWVITNFVIQASLFKYIEINGIKPNTGLIIVICYAILRGDVEGSIIGFCTGFLHDMYFGKIIGLHALLGLLTGYFCGKPFKDFYNENYLLPIVLTGISSLLYETAFYITNFFFMARMDFLFYFERIIFPGSVYNIVFCVPIYMLMYTINRDLESYERKTNSNF